jgi:very-short-patch-repair endonuclease
MLRRNSTPEERRLWSHLRDQQLGGLKFRRQQPFEGYVLDFFCPEKRVDIELDGGEHASPEQRRKDEERDAFLASHGVRTIRFWNRFIRENLNGVLDQLASELGLEKNSTRHQKNSTPHPALSRKGRGDSRTPDIGRFESVRFFLRRSFSGSHNAAASWIPGRTSRSG